MFARYVFTLSFILLKNNKLEALWHQVNHCPTFDMNYLNNANNKSKLTLCVNTILNFKFLFYFYGKNFSSNKAESSTVSKNKYKNKNNDSGL